jgi:hypothetical protein
MKQTRTVSLHDLLCCGAGAGQSGRKTQRTVTGLPRYMMDIPQVIPDEIKLPDAPETARNVRCFRSFTSISAMTDVVRKCGIPDEHQGSGIWIFSTTWRMDRLSRSAQET